VWFGAIALACSAAFAIKDLRWFPSSDLWAQLMLLGVVPTFAWIGWLLVLHYRTNVDPEERARTQLYVGTFLIGVGGPALDLSYIARGANAPSVGAPAMLASALLLAALTFRFRMLRGATMLLLANAVVIGAVGAALLLLLEQWAGQRTA